MKVLDSEKFNLKVNLMIKDSKEQQSGLVRVLLAETYLGFCQTSVMELFLRKYLTAKGC